MNLYFTFTFFSKINQIIWGWTQSRGRGGCHQKLLYEKRLNKEYRRQKKNESYFSGPFFSVRLKSKNYKLCRLYTVIVKYLFFCLVFVCFKSFKNLINIQTSRPYINRWLMNGALGPTLILLHLEATNSLI